MGAANSVFVRSNRDRGHSTMVFIAHSGVIVAISTDTTGWMKTEVRNVKYYLIKNEIIFVCILLWRLFRVAFVHGCFCASLNSLLAGRGVFPFGSSYRSWCGVIRRRRSMVLVDECKELLHKGTQIEWRFNECHLAIHLTWMDNPRINCNFHWIVSYVSHSDRVLVKWNERKFKSINQPNGQIESKELWEFLSIQSSFLSFVAAKCADRKQTSTVTSVVCSIKMLKRLRTNSKNDENGKYFKLYSICHRFIRAR